MTKNVTQLQVLLQIASYLQELVNLTRVMSYPTIKEILETALDTDQKRLVYDLLDGDKKMVTIQQLSGVNISNISQWGQEWEKIGIVEPGTRKGRRRKCFELSMFGLSAPEVQVDEADDDQK